MGLGWGQGNALSAAARQQVVCPSSCNLLQTVTPPSSPLPPPPQMCGVGEPGELLLSGPRLGRGYRGRPDLTADKFVPNPFYDTTADLPPEVRLHSQKVYHTGERLGREGGWQGGLGAGQRGGWRWQCRPQAAPCSPAPAAPLDPAGDLVRWGADGQLEFLGRIDRQVGGRMQLHVAAVGLRMSLALLLLLATAAPLPATPCTALSPPPPSCLTPSPLPPPLPPTPSRSR